MFLLPPYSSSSSSYYFDEDDALTALITITTKTVRSLPGAQLIGKCVNYQIGTMSALGGGEVVADDV